MRPENALTPRPALPPARRSLMGSPVVWARDFGLASAILAGGIICWEGAELMVGLVFTGAALSLGAALGGIAVPLLERSRRVIPFRWLWPIALLTSAAWGAGVTALFALGATVLGPAHLSLWPLLACGAAMGMIFMGWYWFAYTVATVLQRRRWPLLLGVAATVVPAAELMDLLFWLL